jgi:hypothetical protein
MRYGWAFQDFRNPTEGEMFGIENSAAFTIVRCPVCGLKVWVPRGHFDATHNCTLICPYSGDQMWYIPGDPSQAKDLNGNRIVLQGLDGANASEQLIEEFKRYFMYCPNSQCSFYVDNGFAYLQRRVEVEIQVGR